MKGNLFSQGLLPQQTLLAKMQCLSEMPRYLIHCAAELVQVEQLPVELVVSSNLLHALKSQFVILLGDSTNLVPHVFGDVLKMAAIALHSLQKELLVLARPAFHPSF